jgi:hypothetical protein
MNTIDSLLKSAAPDPVRPDPATVDQDLARGRAALVGARRRRLRWRASAGAAALAAAAVVAVVLATSGSSPTRSNTPQASNGPQPTHHAGGPTAGPQIHLVAYTGDQLPGFTVKQVPAGWRLSTSTAFALLITPDDGSTGNDPDVFVGKLAVLTSSTDQHGLGPGASVTVNGQPGKVHTDAGTLMLSYRAPNGFGIDIQAPPTLHWTAAQIVDFAQGVRVTKHAIHGRG